MNYPLRRPDNSMVMISEIIFIILLFGFMMWLFDFKAAFGVMIDLCFIILILYVIGYIIGYGIKMGVGV
jgi:hypothetical protein